MVNPEDVKQTVEKKVALNGETVEKLLFDFLSEIVYCKDAEYVLFSSFKVNIKKNGSFGLTCVMKGDAIRPEEQELRNDVKAVTYHMFEVKKTDRGWRAVVVVDV